MASIVQNRRRRPLRPFRRRSNVHVVSVAEGLELFDAQARRANQGSGEEFLRRWDAGEIRVIPDTPDGRELSKLVDMIPFARPGKS